jgi:hypothetical protein
VRPTLKTLILGLLFSVGTIAGLLHGEAAPADDVNPKANAKQHSVKFVPDQQHGVLSIVIDGNEVAWFDSDGMHVKQSIEYGGTLTDAGTEYLNQRARDHSAR